MPITQAEILKVLGGVIDPNLKTDYVSANAVKDIAINGADISLTIEMGYPAKSLHDSIAEKVRTALQAVDSVGSVNVNIRTQIISHAFQTGLRAIKGVKNIIAISSGKGGVGKSTTTANLALALAGEGARVGVLDADIYGPSQPTIMGISEKPTASDGENLDPIEQYGLQLMSIGFMMDSVQPLAWRAPMITQALMQLLEQTAWKELDYLLIDMPPGTGDIQLTLSQKAPMTGAVVVTTPQEVAVLDAQKGLMMFQKMHVDVLGIVENMSAWVCPCCGEVTHIFGQDGGKRMSEIYGVPSLGQVPINADMCAHTDGGMPAVIADPEGLMARIFRDIAHKVSAAIARKSKDMTGMFPPIKVVAP